MGCPQAGGTQPATLGIIMNQPAPVNRKLRMFFLAIGILMSIVSTLVLGRYGLSEKACVVCALLMNLIGTSLLSLFISFYFCKKIFYKLITAFIGIFIYVCLALSGLMAHDIFKRKAFEHSSSIVIGEVYNSEKRCYRTCVWIAEYAYYFNNVRYESSQVGHEKKYSKSNKITIKIANEYPDINEILQ